MSAPTPTRACAVLVLSNPRSGTSDICWGITCSEAWSSDSLKLAAASTTCGICVQAFVPYGSASVAGALPIPASLQPSSVAAAPNISFPDVTASALFSLARGATTYFGLRFTGAPTALAGRDGVCERHDPWGLSALNQAVTFSTAARARGRHGRAFTL